jgi:hypothetical protein
MTPQEFDAIWNNARDYVTPRCGAEHADAVLAFTRARLEPSRCEDRRAIYVALNFCAAGFRDRHTYETRMVKEIVHASGAFEVYEGADPESLAEHWEWFLSDYEPNWHPALKSIDLGLVDWLEVVSA